MDLGLKGKVAVVTGGAKGIGSGISEVLAEEGCNLVINYRSDKEYCEKFASDLAERTGVKVVTVQGDVSIQETVDKIFDTAIEVFGDVDILINNAGGGSLRSGDGRKNFEDLTYDDWRGVQDNNLNSAFMMCNKFVGHWKRNGRGGHIVNVLSKTCLTTNSINNQAYASAKGGLLALTRSLANEVTPYGIIVNGIVPGYVYNSRTDKDSARYKKMMSLVPTGDYGHPRDMGTVTAFLCSHAANQIIGAVIDCTGGTML